MSDDDFDFPNPAEGFPHRWAHPVRDLSVVRREQLNRLIDKLLALEARTHPQNEAPQEKELDSISALVHAGKLVELLAGWAIDHRAGLILNDVAGYPWPEGDEAAKESANDHRHELEGGAYLHSLGRAQGGGGRPETNLLILAAVVGRAPVLPAELRGELAEALKALDEGERRPLLTSKKGQDRMGRSLWLCRLQAIRHVYFLKETGLKKTEAIARVATAYGVEKVTVEAWDKRGLRRHYGAAPVAAAKDQAEKLGKAVYRKQNTIPQDDDDRAFIQFYLKLYGLPNLASSGQAYKDFMHERARRG